MFDYHFSEKQEEFLNEATYDLSTPEGKNYSRNIELLAFNYISGNMLVRENVRYADARYEKVYIVSRDGRQEKYRGGNL